MLINDAGHWRQRAESARALAKEMNDFGPTVAMLKIADDYDKLARRAAKFNLRRPVGIGPYLARHSADARLRLSLTHPPSTTERIE
jgi:hypothetical protein